MNLSAMINRFFGKDSGQSKNIAKDRLRLVLMQDRSNISPEIFEKLKVDLIEVINKYMEIDKESLEVSLTSSEDHSIALMANIPVLGMRR